MLFQELVEQHRVHCFVANSHYLPVLIANDQVRIHLLYFFRYQAELRDTFWIKLFLVAEGDRLQRQDSFARFVHRLDRFLEPGRGGSNTKLTS